MYLVERGGEVKLSGNKVVQRFDWTLSHLDAEQTNDSLRPTLASEKHAKRYFISFNGNQRMTSAIDLNPTSGSSDRVHVFLIFRLHSHNGSNAHFRNGLFGHDNGGWDKFLAYKPKTHDLLISGVKNADNVLVTSFDWKSKVDVSEVNKWICLSCHWNVPEDENGSSLWVNGKKVKEFTAATSVGSTKMTFGDLDPSGIAGLDGNIQMFLLYKEFAMDERVILAHHQVFCENI